MRWAASVCAFAERARGGAIAGSLRLIAIAASGLAGAAIAQPPTTLTLSDAEKAALLAEHSEASVAAARSGADTGRRIHGTIGAAIGSNGARSSFGAASIPIGDHAGATVSFESSRWGGPR